MNAYAHILRTENGLTYEPIEDHLHLVAEKARTFAAAFGGEEWGHLIGLWHDLGKYSREFQRYIVELDSEGTVDHSTAGAQAACGRRGDMLATYPIAGHHAGLPDYTNEHGSCLSARIKKDIPIWRKYAPEHLLSIDWPAPPDTPLFKNKYESSQKERLSFGVSLYIRMLYSCLVDADYLSTEEFMSPATASLRRRKETEPAILYDLLMKHIHGLIDSSIGTHVNFHRRSVLEECIHSAQRKPGFFSLCVPTGGGKTLSSMAFALKHADIYSKDRVIVVEPYTSIIEQTAEVYRDIFGNNNVLEHHSAVESGKVSYIQKLHTENWDAPIIVTTAVQFFESFFSARSRKCRKLHNVANSVVILDEAQTIPVFLLKPTLYLLQELVDTYKCSVVICSATQPAIEKRDGFDIGVTEVRPIVEDSTQLYEALRRVRVHVEEETLNADVLAERMSKEPSVLCIVNTKPDAREVFDALPGLDGTYHLSTNMCAAHRLDIINVIKERLSADKPCRVVSTQLIEAGVDIDFPVVYRARCGLDSLAQAAGRCNREGVLKEGRVVWFDYDGRRLPGDLQRRASKGYEISRLESDLLSPQAIDRYFNLLYWAESSMWDKEKTFGCLISPAEIQFRKLQDKYKIIKDETYAVVVPYGRTGKKLTETLLMEEEAGWPLLRKAQRYLVQVRKKELEQLEEGKHIVHTNGIYVLVNSALYSQHVGMVMPHEG